MSSKSPQIFSVSTFFAAPKYSLDLYHNSLQQVVSQLCLLRININRYRGCLGNFKPCAMLLSTSECFVCHQGYNLGMSRVEELFRFIPPFSAEPHFHLLLDTVPLNPWGNLQFEMFQALLSWDPGHLPKVWRLLTWWSKVNHRCGWLLSPGWAPAQFILCPKCCLWNRELQTFNGLVLSVLPLSVSHPRTVVKW